MPKLNKVKLIMTDYYINSCIFNNEIFKRNRMGKQSELKGDSNKPNAELAKMLSGIWNQFDMSKLSLNNLTINRIR